MVDLIVDANSFWAHSYYSAVKHGRDPVGVALRQTIRMLRDDHRYFLRSIDRMLFCWDGLKAKTEKKRTVEKPADYHSKLSDFSTQLTQLTHCAQVMLDDHEADDLVASASEQSKAEHVVIVSGDKDLSQLQCDRVSFYDVHMKMLLSRRAICERWNVYKPIQVAIALAIIGDTGDGIKGVHKWGKGKFQKLFADIPAEMPFDQIIDNLLSQMKEEQQTQFLESLAVTLLDTTISGIPEPALVALDEAMARRIDREMAMPWGVNDKAAKNINEFDRWMQGEQMRTALPESES